MQVVRPARHILTVNTGSSSLKAAIYAVDSQPVLQLAAEVSRIGASGGTISFSDRTGIELTRDASRAGAFDEALRDVLAGFDVRAPGLTVAAVGHRMVHGGSKYTSPRVISSEVLSALEQLVAIDPLHLPQALVAVRAAGRAFPDVPQVACFDTAFHRSMPAAAQTYPLPRQLTEAGLLRFGFHGLSYEYIVQELRAQNPSAASGRLVVAHLGNGASMAAIRDGASRDTTMGFTPTGGLMMGTRSGDLDPGVLLYLLTQRGLSPQAVDELVNRQSGLLGVSGTSADMRELLDAEATDESAAEAVELFCYQARKFLGSLVAVLGGLETLVFTGGIGERAAPVRQRICEPFQFLGLQIDASHNAADDSVISTIDSSVKVRVMPTDEDLMIARHTNRLLWSEGSR